VSSKNNSNANVKGINFIGQGTHIEGNVKIESSIIIDGSIKGKIICKNTVTIGEKGSVEGDIEALNAIVSGKIKGKIIVGEKLILHEKSSLVGELKAKKLIIFEGSVFEGTSDMGVSKISTTSTPVSGEKVS